MVGLELVVQLFDLEPHLGVQLGVEIAQRFVEEK